MRHPFILMLAAAAATCDALAAPAADWPMWSRDAARSGVPPAPLPEQLHLHWVRRLPAPRRAWPAYRAASDSQRFTMVWYSGG